MLKRFIGIILIMALSLAIGYIPADAATSTSSIKTTKDLEKYLKKNYGTLKTKYKTFDLEDSISVIKNEDEYTCFDIAIVIDWSAVEDGYYKIKHSTKYTKAQKKAFDKALKTYQRKIATVAMKVFPKKKIRGGFLDYGYEYPAIEDGYYEGAIYGWKNYDYGSSSIFPGYDDTKVSEFNWDSFNSAGHPLDKIGLY